MMEFVEIGIRTLLVHVTCGVALFAALVLMKEIPEEATPKFCLVVILLWPVVYVAMVCLIVRETWRVICSLKRTRKEKDDERGE